MLYELIYRARYFSRLSKRKTVDGIWFLTLIAYVYTADACLNLLRCVQVYEPTKFKGKLVSVELRASQQCLLIFFIYTFNATHHFLWDSTG